MNAVVREVLEKSNYNDWRVRVKTYLMAQDLWNVIEAKTEAPKQDDEVAFKTWSKKNSVALDAIRNSCGLATFSEIKEITLAKTAWDTLAEKYSQSRNTNAGLSLLPSYLNNTHAQILWKLFLVLKLLPSQVSVYTAKPFWINWKSVKLGLAIYEQTHHT